MTFLKVIVMLVFLFLIQSLFAQDIDKSLYQKTTMTEVDWTTGVTEYYKFDAVFVDRKPHENAGAGNEFFKFFEFDGDSSYDRGTNFPGPNTLPPIKPGQFVTVYFHLSPGRTPQGLRKYLIDHIEIPTEDFSFIATHKTNKETDILFSSSYETLFTVNSGVEVQVLGRNFHVSQEEDGKGGILTGYWMWLVTGDAYGGWVFSSYLEPLPHVANIEISTNFSFKATHRVIKETTIWEYPGEEPKTTIDSGAEVMVTHTNPNVVSSEGETDYCLYLVTTDGYQGYAFASHFESLQQVPTVESPPPAVVNEPEPAIVPEAEQSSGFPLQWVIAGLSVVLLGVIIAVVAAKRKKKERT